MLTPEDIRRQAEAKYSRFIEAHFGGSDFFPLEFRFGRVDAKAPLRDIVENVARLLEGQASPGRAGYQVHLEIVNTRTHGAQSLPQRVWFEDAENYLCFIGKNREFQAIEKCLADFRAVCPGKIFHEWIAVNPRVILRRLHLHDGRALGLALHALHSSPRPDCYPREILLPGVSGKFIEDNLKLIGQILKECESPAYTSPPTLDDYEALGLLRPKRLIRHRSLSDGGYPDQGTCVDQMTVVAGTTAVIVVENLRTYLTLPILAGAIAIYGEGNAVQTLSKVEGLGGIPMFYWGDIDTYGFVILDRLRGLYPACKSLLMDEAIYTALTQEPSYLAPCKTIEAPEFTRLSETEYAIASIVNSTGMGIEQEKIPLDTVRHAFENLR